MVQKLEDTSPSPVEFWKHFCHHLQLCIRQAGISNAQSQRAQETLARHKLEALRIKGSEDSLSPLELNELSQATQTITQAEELLAKKVRFLTRRFELKDTTGTSK